MKGFSGFFILLFTISILLLPAEKSDKEKTSASPKSLDFVKSKQSFMPRRTTQIRLSLTFPAGKIKFGSIK